MPADESLKGPEITRAWYFPSGSARKIEQVGEGYERLKKKHSEMWERVKKGASAHFESDDESKPKSGSDEETKDDPTEDLDEHARADFEKKRKKKTKEEIEKEALEGNLYGMLELQDKTYEAGEKDIAKAYKKLALKYHPDKLGDRITEKDKEIWLKIQEAYETLIYPVKRRKYDSSLPFEDKIPGEDDFTEETFYDVLGKAFTLNSMWSKKKPAPNFGDETTPLDEVKRFYKFWDSFQSWREFSQYDEYDVNDAQDRYEKRAMEREN